MTEPVVSIVVGVLNGAKTLDRCIDSIVGQTPVEYRARTAVMTAPTCFTMAWTRPSA